MIGQINIIGTIGKDVNLVDVISQVERQRGVSSYRVSITTKGGSVKEGYDIYNFLVSLGLPIEMIGSNIVASIGTVIFMAGTSRRIEHGTNFFIHLPSIPELQNATADDLDAYSKEMRKIENKVIDFYTKNTGMNVEAIKPMLENQTYLNDEQLFSMGFTTEQAPLPIQAIAFLDKEFKKPDMNTTTRKQANSIMKLVSNFLKGDIANMKMVLTADQRQLDFPDVAEEGMFMVGDMATLDGVPAQGDVLLADGRTITFDAGIVVTITEVAGDPAPAPDSDDDNSEVEALKKENTELRTKLASSVTALQTAKTETTELQTKLQESKSVMLKIQNVQSTMLANDNKIKQEEQRANAQNRISDSVEKLMNL